MLSPVRKNISNSARILVIAVTFLALFNFGNSLIAVTSTPHADENSEAKAPTQCRLVAGVSLPESSDGSMANGETKETHSLYFTVPAVAPTYSVDDNRPEAPVIETKASPRIDLNRRHCGSTTASISSSKAREFTLVGAKPSGTS